ncbi:MAG: PAS domain S-box-containing protein [Natronomonas sp.]|jgi:PAS domain S-box-containing protein|uniref:PAS domain-containing response regulator n=1 Tax=Natronomonas sp. TaxID=2184060 RepID=UPI00398A5091
MSVERSSTKPKPQGRPIRIAYVDDHEGFGELTADSLEAANERLSVATVTTPDTVTDRLGEFDCIVSDYEMPGTDGLELLRQVRVLDEEIPFILFTGDGSEGVASDAISLGVTDYIAKGGGQERFERLAHRVESVVDAKRATEAVEKTREKAAAAIERERARFRALIEQSPAMMAVMNQSGAFEYVSPSVEDITGYSSRELRESVAFEHVHEDDRERVIEEFRRSLTNPEYRPRVEYRFQHKSGAWLHLESKGVSRLDDPAVEGFVVNTRDVTEQHRTKEQLQREREIADRLLEVSPTPIILADANGRIVRANERAADVFGVSVDELTGMAPSDGDLEIRTPSGDPLPVHELIAPKVVDSGADRRGIEYHVTIPTGEYRLVVSAALLTETDRTAAVVSIDEIEPLDTAADNNT